MPTGHVAAYKGHRQIVLLLLQKGANMNQKTKTGATPLMCAKGRGHASVAELLRKHGAVE